MFTTTIEIERPTAEVFAYVSHVAHAAEWSWAVSEITALKPDELLEVDAVLASLPAHLTYRFHATAGGTTLASTVEVRPDGALGVVAPAVGRHIQHAVAESLEVLKARLEARSEVSGGTLPCPCPAHGRPRQR